MGCGGKARYEVEGVDGEVGAGWGVDGQGGDISVLE